MSARRLRRDGVGDCSAVIAFGDQLIVCGLRVPFLEECEECWEDLREVHHPACCPMQEDQ